YRGISSLSGVCDDDGLNHGSQFSRIDFNVAPGFGLAGQVYFISRADCAWPAALAVIVAARLRVRHDVSGQLSLAARMDRVQREWRRHRLSRRDEYSAHLPRWERALDHSSMSTRWVWAVRPGERRHSNRQRLISSATPERRCLTIRSTTLATSAIA